MIDPTLASRLQALLAASFCKMTYTEAIARLQEAVKNGHIFENAAIANGAWTFKASMNVI
jgi:hypothetical protein